MNLVWSQPLLKLYTSEHIIIWHIAAGFVNLGHLASSLVSYASVQDMWYTYWGGMGIDWRLRCAQLPTHVAKMVQLCSHNLISLLMGAKALFSATDHPVPEKAQCTLYKLYTRIPTIFFLFHFIFFFIITAGSFVRELFFELKYVAVWAHCREKVSATKGIFEKKG